MADAGGRGAPAPTEAARRDDGGPEDGGAEDGGRGDGGGPADAGTRDTGVADDDAGVADGGSDAMADVDGGPLPDSWFPLYVPEGPAVTLSGVGSNSSGVTYNTRTNPLFVHPNLSPRPL